MSTTAAVTATQILATLRSVKPHPIVREVVINDPYWQAAYNLFKHQAHPHIYTLERYAARGEEVATELPDDFNPRRGSTRRIDGLMLGAKGRLTAIEIKISRADFRRDTPTKTRAWREVTHNFVYATPPGLVTPVELPAGCGLWEVDPDEYYLHDRVKSVVRPKPNKAVKPLPQNVWHAMFWRVSNYERTTDTEGQD